MPPEDLIHSPAANTMLSMLLAYVGGLLLGYAVGRSLPPSPKATPRKEAP